MRIRWSGRRPRRPVTLLGVVLVTSAALFLSSTAVAGASGNAASARAKAAEAQAKKKLLVRADFPSGWSGQGSVVLDNGAGSANIPGGAATADCLGISKALLELNTPSATSPTFQTKNELDSVEDNVSIFPSAKLAGQAYAAISGPKVPACLTTAFQGPARQGIVDAVGHGITVGTITVTAADPTRLIKHSSGFTISFPVNYQGNNLNADITLISMVRGNTDSQLTVSVVGNPLPATLERHLLTVAYGRT